jgi:hypothetical protein
MDHSRALPHMSRSLKLAVCCALTAFAIGSGILAARLCGDVLRQMAQPLAMESTRVTVGE